MTLEEIWEKARSVMAPNCRACPECNGLACRGQIPGVGGIGSGSSFTVCREYLRRVKLMMDVIYEPGEIDPSIELFGRRFALPVFMAPIGGMTNNYNGAISDRTWAEISIRGMVDGGSLAFTPDGPNEKLFRLSLPVIQDVGGLGVPTIKPWAKDELLGRLRDVEASGACAVAVDIDSCGNPNLKLAGKPVYPMAPALLREITQGLRIPFIMKGVMTAASALRCADAGCYGIVVSTHGGRVIEDAPAPCSMLPEIREAVGSRVKIFVDGGIRSGLDVFKCLALGADAVLIGRPYVVAGHGGGREGVALYTEKILENLRENMLMTGCRRLSDIGPEKIRIE
ncbi:MAG: alpha-hydroxy-acid oxidizing protein [Oscillospiraceae bacterium]|nr:alpha-hydroxy-acid oxidizing protein [Oscillospiraceae bacterium]